MAKAFNLTAQINIQGPNNLKPTIAKIRRDLGSLSTDVKVNIDPRSVKTVEAITARLRTMNTVLAEARKNTDALNTSFRGLSASLGSVQGASRSVSTNLKSTSENVKATAKNINIARTEMEEFGKQSALAIRRFAAFSVVTSSIFALTNAITSGFKAFIQFDRELIRLQQVTNKGALGIADLEKEITRLSTTLGVSSESLMTVATTLAQAGLTADETRIALSALAKTELAPSFDSLTETTEGAIAAMRQFGLAAGDLEDALGSINAVAAAFAVESSDIITAIQRTGGVFASASKGVSQGKQALNEFLAIFTSVRATTRESAETIATGLRTIFTRIQRPKTIEQLKSYGVALQDLEGKFVGPFEAVKRLSEALNQLDPRDVRFATIVEELGGFRQIGKVIPLIQQFASAQQALGVAQQGQKSLYDDQITAQQSLANQIAKVREQFLALIRDVGKSAAFQSLFKIVLGLTSGLISLASAFKPILPILAVFGAIKGVSAIGQFASGFFGGLKKGGGAGGAGENIGGAISGANERERTQATSQATSAIRENTSALQALTRAIENNTRARGGSGTTGFASGGVVPGSGNRDTVPAMLTPGEFVIRKRAVETIGVDNLQKMNKYGVGGLVIKSLDSEQFAGLFARPKGADRSGKPVSIPFDKIENDKEVLGAVGKPRSYFIGNTDESTFTAEAENALFNSIDTLAGRLSGDIPKIPDDNAIKSSLSNAIGVNDIAGKMFEGVVRVISGYFSGGSQAGWDIPRGQVQNQGLLSTLFNSGNILPDIDYDAKLSETTSNRASLIKKAITSGIPSDIIPLTSFQRQLKTEDLIKLPKGPDRNAALNKRRAELETAKNNAARLIEDPDTLDTVLKRIGKQAQAITAAIPASARNFALGGLIKRFALGGQVYDLQKGTGLSDGEFNELVRYAKTNDFTEIEFKDYLKKYLDSKAAKKNLMMDPSQLRQVLLSGTTTPPSTSKQMDLARQLMGSPDAKYNPKYDNAIKRFASGGSAEDTVPALLTPGEFVINKKAAQRIGYSKLHKLNQADKLQGYNSGGIVGGIQGFKEGGIPEKVTVETDPAVIKKIDELTRRIADLWNVAGRKMGFAGEGGGTKKIDNMDLSSGGRRAMYIARPAQTGAEMMERFAREGARPGAVTATKFANPTPEELRNAQLYEHGGFRAAYSDRGGLINALEGGRYGGDNPKNIESSTKEVDRLLSSAKTELEDIAKLEQEIADIRQSGIKPVVQQAPKVQAQTQAVAAAATVISPPTPPTGGGSKPPSNLRRSGGGGGGVNPPGPPSGGGGNRPPVPPPVPPAGGGSPRSPFAVNPRIADEQRAFMEYKAEKAGMSVGGYKYSLGQQVGQAAYNVQQESRFAKQETRNIAAGRARDLKGIDIKQSLQADTQEGRRVQSIIDEFAANIQKIDPSLGADKARDAAIKMAEGLSDGTQSVEEIIKANSELSGIFDKTIDDAAAMNEAFRRVAQSTGESESLLRSAVSPTQIKQQQFIASREGQRFGSLAQFAPGALEKFSKTGLGKTLGSGADFISGKGGKASQLFARAGGIAGIGSAVTVGAEALKQFLPASTTSDPNTAGALGALSGAGSGAATGAMLGGQLAGPVGALVAGVGGAIIGGIQGFFNAKNQAILTNALEGLAKSTGELDTAFKKLDQSASKGNFTQAQKAFGKVLESQKTIDKFALGQSTLTGTDAMSIGGTALAGGATGAALGAIIGTTVLPAIGTAAGAAIGGALGAVGGAGYAYFNRPSEAQRKEALTASIQQGSANQAAAMKLAQTKLSSTSTADLDKMLKSLQSGTSALNPIVEEYAQGMAAASGKTVEEVRAMAEEKAAIDAFMKIRKESGATDEQIQKELQSNRKEAINTGKQASAAAAELMIKQDMLAKATKEVAIATENLLDVYRRVNANIQRFEDEVGNFLSGMEGMIGDLGGNAKVQNVNRQNEQVLGNLSGYSAAEVRAAASGTAGLLGNTPEATDLANTASAAKILQDQLPAMLRNATTEEQRSNVVSQLRSLFKEQGLDSGAIDQVLSEIDKKIENNVSGNIGTLIQEIDANILGEFSKTAQEGANTLKNLASTYNNTLQKAIDLQNQYNQAILQANSYLRKAGQVRLNAELELARALGRSPTLQELNKPFDVEIQNLTQGLVNTGDLAAGQAMDPMSIARAISSAAERNRAIEEANVAVKGAGAGLPAGDQRLQQATQAQFDNIEALGANKVAIDEGRQALERLANDGTKAANALAKIQEEQQAFEGFSNFVDKVMTANPQELFEMEMQTAAFKASQVAGPDFMKSRFNRQQAKAGLELQRGIMTPQEYREANAEMQRKFFESQGMKGGDVVTKIAGKDVTVDEYIKRMKEGVADQDPNVIAFREATEVQAKANEALGMLNLEQAGLIQEAMIGLEQFLSTEFPAILTKAVTAARADAQAKPETKTDGAKPSGPTAAELAKGVEQENIRQAEESSARIQKQIEEKEKAMARTTGSSAMAQKMRANDQKDLNRLKAEKAEQDKLAASAKARLATADQTIKSEQDKAAADKVAADAAAKAKTEAEAKAKADEALKQSTEARSGTAVFDKKREDAKKRIEELKQTIPTRQQTAQTATPVQEAAKTAQTEAKTKASEAAQQELDRLNGVKEDKAREIAAAEKKLMEAQNYQKSAIRAAAYAGSKDSVTVAGAEERVKAAQVTLDNAKADMVVIDTSMTELKSSQQPVAASSVAPVSMQPVPSTLPSTPGYGQQTQQRQTATTSTTPAESTTFTLDPASIEGLNTFNTNFASYVDRLVSFEFPRIPESIEMTGNHTVDVRITGAAAFDALKKDFSTMIVAEVSKAMGKIWNNTGGAIGSPPTSGPTPGQGQ